MRIIDFWFWGVLNKFHKIFIKITKKTTIVINAQKKCFWWVLSYLPLSVGHGRKR